MGEEALFTAVMISDVSRKIMLVSEGCVRAGTQYKDTAAELHANTRGTL